MMQFVRVRSISRVILILLGAGVAMAASQVPEKEILIFTPEVFKERKHGPVPFAHKKHEQLECAQCHHDYKDGTNVWKQGDEVKKCGACHKLESTEEMPSLERAMHAHCLRCHKDRKKAGKKAGPAVCLLCHPKTDGKPAKK